MTTQANPQRAQTQYNSRNTAQQTSGVESKSSASSGLGKRRVDWDQEAKPSLSRGGELSQEPPLASMGRFARSAEDSKATQEKNNDEIITAPVSESVATHSPQPEPGFPEVDEKLHQIASQGLENFIDQIVTDPAETAEEFAHASLLCSMAGSAIAQFIQEEGAFEWLALRGGKHLAEWAEKNQALLYGADGFFHFTSKLNTYINGEIRQATRFPGGPYTIKGMHPDVGQEVVRFLQSLKMPSRFRQKIHDSPRHQPYVLEMFCKVLERLEKTPVHNQYLFGYTVQQITTQSFHMLEERYYKLQADEKELFHRIHILLEALENKSEGVIIVNTGGGSYISGTVEVRGDLIGRDKIITDFCCAPAEGAA